jgi:hypothetical protein
MNTQEEKRLGNLLGLGVVLLLIVEVALTVLYQFEVLGDLFWVVAAPVLVAALFVALLIGRYVAKRAPGNVRWWWPWRMPWESRAKERWPEKDLICSQCGNLILAYRPSATTRRGGSAAPWWFPDDVTRSRQCPTCGALMRTREERAETERGNPEPEF